MNRKSVGLILPALFVLAVLLLFGYSLTRAQAGQRAAKSAAVGTAFTYQGRLNDGGTPATGNYDFEFGLYDDLTIGNQVGITVPQTIVVNDGLFTTALDFGPDLFNGESRYLEIAVQFDGGGFTTLTPRQPLTAVPYASYADKVQPVENVVVVAKSGGDFTSIQSALTSITDASASNPYLVWIAPGTYTETVTMKSYVDIEGAGEIATKITYTGAAALDTGTVVGANNAELRFLTVENTGGSTLAVAIYNSSAAPNLTHVTANISGSTNNYGVYNNGSSPTMNNLTIIASGTSNYGVYNISSSSPTMNNSTITASGSGNNFGVYNHSSSSPTMNNLTATASGGSGNYGMRNYQSSPTILNSRISGDTWGIRNDADSGTYTVSVNNSQINGTTNSIYNDAEFTTYVGASLLDGGAVDANGGTVRCADSHNASGVELNSTCDTSVVASDGYENVVVVAKSGGDFTSIQSALTSITDASASNPYLVWIAPGTYTETVTMKSYVDIEGAGEIATKITYTGSAAVDTGTVVGANNAELRFLTVESTSSSNFFAIAIYNSSAAPSLTHLTILASGTGSTVPYGVVNTSSSPTMNNLTISASGNSPNGVQNSVSSSPAMNNVTINVSGHSSIGLKNSSSSPTMKNMTITASGGQSRGVHNFESSPTILNSSISGDISGISNQGSSGTYTVKVNHSQISGVSNTILNDNNFTTYVGTTLLDGGAVDNTTSPGTLTCVGAFDETYVALNSICE